MRKARKMTQAELAAALGYSRKSIISWENSVHPIPDDVAVNVTALCFDIASVVAPKESAKLILSTLEAYRKMRAHPNNFSHEWIMDMWEQRGFAPCFGARKQIAAEFPDILNPPSNPTPNLES